jgi:hypothetical protein
MEDRFAMTMDEQGPKVEEAKIMEGRDREKVFASNLKRSAPST